MLLLQRKLNWAAQNPRLDRMAAGLDIAGLVKRHLRLAFLQNLLALVKHGQQQTVCNLWRLWPVKGHFRPELLSAS